MKELTPKQKMFCKEYLVDLSATNAAKRAGYSKKTATEIGYENLTKPHIQKYIKKQMDKRFESVDLSVEYILDSIHEIGKRCMQRSKVMVREGKHFVQKMEFNEDGEEVGVWEFREMGALKAFELLGKHKHAFNNGKDESNGDTFIFNDYRTKLEGLDADQLREVLQGIRTKITAIRDGNRIKVGARGPVQPSRS